MARKGAHVTIVITHLYCVLYCVLRGYGERKLGNKETAKKKHIRTILKGKNFTKFPGSFMGL